MSAIRNGKKSSLSVLKLRAANPPARKFSAQTNKLNTSGLIVEVAEMLSKDTGKQADEFMPLARKTVEHQIAFIRHCLMTGKSVTFKNLGTLAAVIREPRTYYDPQREKATKKPRQRRVKFIPAISFAKELAAIKVD
jgi:nucleoid DNA-binding protein